MLLPGIVICCYVHYRVLDLISSTNEIEQIEQKSGPFVDQNNGKLVTVTVRFLFIEKSADSKKKAKLSYVCLRLPPIVPIVFFQ